MNENPLVEKQVPYEPGVLTRLMWWWFIYLVPPELGILLYAIFYTHSLPDFPSSFFLVALIFPTGFAPGLGPLFPTVLYPFILVAGYIFYLGHLIYTFCVRSRKKFRVAMIILIIAVIINLAGCDAINKQLSNFAP